MIIQITKGLRNDCLAITRTDGSTDATSFPKKGPTSHDAIHYFVESELGLKNAFWGMIASGHGFEDIQNIAKNAGHASASRAEKPDAEIIELLQAERLVECFEVDQWGAPSDAATFIVIATEACERSHVPLPPQLSGQFDTLRSRIANFQASWGAAHVPHVVEFEWEEQ